MQVRMTLPFCSELQGTFIYLELNLLVKADATNWHLNCDHLALADSLVDSTKAQ
jgi:hypothetical protein